MTLLKKYFRSNTWVILTMILLIEFMFNLVLKFFVLNDKVVYNSLAEQMTLEEINTAMVTIRSNTILLLLFGLAQRMAELLLIAACINIGTLLFHLNVSFKAIWNVVVKSYVVFILSRIFLMLAIAFGGVETFEDLNYIPQFSLAELIGADSISSWALYPLQLVNIFQLLFILLLTTGLNLLDKRGFNKWLGLVLVTYGIGLVIAVILTSFLVVL